MAFYRYWRLAHRMLFWHNGVLACCDRDEAATSSPLNADG
ncbi:hypothetical protein AVDCRST_MAG94-3975 [uncultured Leptolyngbya sp.]|uniref:Uncharacterized protein n=1 Tax=uncultured Leptolyngbya sp. TaxID=332963 RepID=A0A6J4MUA3_9CYAN|nr:hypothetical protein AVDCRST_MAG94-3975 [uncultured Leptolyngbya sp.]